MPEYLESHSQMPQLNADSSFAQSRSSFCPSAYLHFTALSPPSSLECVFDQSAEVRTAAAVDDMLAARKTETVMAAVCSLRCGGEGTQ